jgi:hypothetical protein
MHLPEYLQLWKFRTTLRRAWRAYDGSRRRVSEIVWALLFPARGFFKGGHLWLGIVCFAVVPFGFVIAVAKLVAIAALKAPTAEQIASVPPYFVMAAIAGLWSWLVAGLALARFRDLPPEEQRQILAAQQAAAEAKAEAKAARDRPYQMEWWRAYLIFGRGQWWWWFIGRKR